MGAVNRFYIQCVILPVRIGHVEEEIMNIIDITDRDSCSNREHLIKSQDLSSDLWVLDFF